MLRAAPLAALVAGWTAALAPPSAGCGLALALAVDISGSVDPKEYRIQMQGISAALRDGLIAEALVRARAAVSVVQWTGSSRQIVSIPWTPITGFEDVEALAARIDRTPRGWRNFSTAVGEALRFTMGTFDGAPDCARRIIDISGDGRSNEGAPPRDIHGALKARDIQVNGLAIEGAVEDLTAYYWENVIRGEGAFVVTARGYDDYPRAIRRKLLREVTRQIARADR